MKKQKEPVFKVGDVVCVVMPTMAVNMKPNDETNKLDIDEVMLVGDEGLVITEAEYVKNTDEYLYQVLTQIDLDAKIFSLSEEQLALYDQESQ